MKMMKRFSVFAALALTLVLTGCGIVDQGQVGVRTQFGQIDPKVEEAGFYTAVLSDVTQYTVKETTVELDRLTPQAKDKMTLQAFGATVFYQANGSLLPAFQGGFSGQSARLSGEDFYRPGYVMVSNFSRSAVMDEVSKFNADQLNTQRGPLETGIKANIQKRLDEKAPGVFTVTAVTVREIVNDESVQNSIRDNVTAQNRLDTATKLVSVRHQEALANEKLAQSFTPAFLQHEYNLALLACAESQKCTLIVDGSASGKTLNLGQPR